MSSSGIIQFSGNDFSYIDEEQLKRTAKLSPLSHSATGYEDVFRALDQARHQRLVQSPTEARWSLACFVCDSYYAPDCAEPFDNRTYALFRCPPGHNKCSVTLLQNNNDDIETPRYIRECAEKGRVLSNTGCLMGWTGKHQDMKCFCDNMDGCNQDIQF